MINVGDRVKTTYSEREHIIKKITGPCMCEPYTNTIGMTNEKPKKHYHYRGVYCFDNGPSYFNNYDLEGNNVYNDDKITIIEKTKKPIQLSIF